MQSKRALLEWLKNDLQEDIKTIEELGKGFIYAQLLANYDSTFPAKNINKNAKSEAEYLKNLKLCQDYFSRNSITVFFPIDKMAKCKVQDNLEFIQWLYKFLHKKDEKEGGGKVSSSVDNSAHNTSSSSYPRMRVMKQTPVAQSTKENQNRPNLSGQQSNLADNSFNKSMTTASNKATASTTKIKSHFSANQSRQESSNAIIENYAADTNICKSCVENSEINKKYKSQHFYLESKIKYYEKMNAEVDKNSEELAIKENSLKEKESVLMRQALINMDESKEVKRMEDKLAILQDELKLANEALIDCKQKNVELEIRNKEILLHINNLEKNEEKSRDEFANEVEKLKEYYDGIINNKDKEFGEAKINYLQFIKGYEKERDMYYVKLKEVEAYLKQHCGNEDLKNNIFHLLYKKE